MVSPVEEVVKTESLVKTLNSIACWGGQIKAGKRREAEHTLATLVISTTNPKRNLPKMAQFLRESQVEVGSEMVKKTKGPKNPGVSRHARDRGIVIVINNGTALVEFKDDKPAYVIVDKTGGFFYSSIQWCTTYTTIHFDTTGGQQ